MDKLNTVLGILASIISILSVLMSVNNSKNIRKIKGKIESGDNSVNTVGSENTVSK